MSDILRTRRLELGLSQSELAAAVGVDRRQIHRYEAGQAHPTLPVARALAHRLDITLDELAGNDASDLSGDWLSGWQVQDDSDKWIVVQQPVRAMQRGDRIEFNPPPDQAAEFPWHGELTIVDAAGYGSFTADKGGLKPRRGVLVVSIDQTAQQITGGWVTVGTLTKPVLSAPFALVRPGDDLIATLSRLADRS